MWKLDIGRKASFCHSIGSSNFELSYVSTLHNVRVDFFFYMNFRTIPISDASKNLIWNLILKGPFRKVSNYIITKLAIQRDNKNTTNRLEMLRSYKVVIHFRFWLLLWYHQVLVQFPLHKYDKKLSFRISRTCKGISSKSFPKSHVTIA